MGWHEERAIQFINPYNFVPLGNKCNREKEAKGELSGVIECSLIPKTDIFIPNTSNDSAFGNFGVENHKSYEFFSYKDLTGQRCNEANNAGPKKPVIPGSEIRGVIRNAYEILTDSCLSTLDTKKVLSTRTINIKKTGILFKENENWIIKKANRYAVKLNVKGNTLKRYIEINKKEYKTGDVVRFDIRGRRAIVNNTGSQKGYLLIGEASQNKKYDSIFVVNKGQINVTEKDLNNFKISIENFYRKIQINKKYGDGHYGYPNMNLQNGMPVWYEEIGGHIYLSPACIGRNIYYNTLNSLAGTYSPCESKNDLCSGCNVFGMVSEKNDKEAKASKVRFTDAKINDETKVNYGNVIAIKELASPKISSVEFYTYINGGINPEYWNYDYYTIYGKPNVYKALENNISLRGRKFYWHYKGGYVDNNITERNITIRPLKADDKTIFNFKVYFEKLTEEELKKLLFTLSVGSNEGNGCYKIGTGKPLGLGSIKIKVDSIKLRKLGIKENKIFYGIEDTTKFKEYYTNFTSDYYKSENKEDSINRICKFVNINKETLGSFMKLTDFNGLSEIDKGVVLYPVGENIRTGGDMMYSTANWFVGNRAIATAATKPKFKNKLPKATEKNIRLPKIINT